MMMSKCTQCNSEIKKNHLVTFGISKIDFGCND